MAASKLIAILGALVFSASALASSACGFAIPDDGAVKMQVDDGCTYVVQNNKTYHNGCVVFLFLRKLDQRSRKQKCA